MSSDCSFYEHIDLKIKQCRQLTGWILRTFKAGADWTVGKSVIYRIKFTKKKKKKKKKEKKRKKEKKGKKIKINKKKEIKEKT